MRVSDFLGVGNHGIADSKISNLLSILAEGRAMRKTMSFGSIGSQFAYFLTNSIDSFVCSPPFLIFHTAASMKIMFQRV